MKDNRDPQQLGTTLLRMADIDRHNSGYLPNEWKLSDVYENHADFMQAIPAARDVPAHLRYPRVDELVVETLYRRLPIDRLAEGPQA